MADINQAKLTDLKKKLQGNVLIPESPEYDEARQLWNGMIDKRPALIARCATPQDIIDALSWGRDAKLDIAIRRGGHNIAGLGSCDGGMLIDLSGMREVSLDVQGRRALVEPGATLADLDHVTETQGWIVPTGINSTTGIAGLTLGGGFGWTTRKFGMTIDSLTRAEVVTAEGKLLEASEHTNPDLFWAIRGGGGNFGIVTRFEFEVHPMPYKVMTGLLVYPLDQAEKLLKRYREFVSQAPDELSLWAILRKAPPLPFLDSQFHGEPSLILAFCYLGSEAEGRPALAPILNLHEPMGHLIAMDTFRHWQTTFDPLLTAGARNYWKSHNFTELSDELIQNIIPYAKDLPSDQTEIFIASVGGAASRVPVDRTAYAHREAQFIMNVHARWEQPENDQGCISWARDFFNSAKPFATGGVYTNFMTADESNRIASAYG